MQLPDEEQPVNKLDVKPDNNPAPAKAEVRINLRRDTILRYIQLLNNTEKF